MDDVVEVASGLYDQGGFEEAIDFCIEQLKGSDLEKRDRGMLELIAAKSYLAQLQHGDSLPEGRQMLTAGPQPIDWRQVALAGIHSALIYLPGGTPESEEAQALLDREFGEEEL